MIVYEKVFANEKLIYSKIDRAINGKITRDNHNFLFSNLVKFYLDFLTDGYKKIALSVVIMGDNIQNVCYFINKFKMNIANFSFLDSCAYFV